MDSTGLALQALAAARVPLDDAAVQAGLVFLRSVQNEDGGFPGYGGDTDPASTGLALQGLATYGQNPRSLAWTTTIGDGSASALTLRTAVETLLALQSPAGGFPGFSGPNDPFSSYQALAGLTGPVAAHPPAAELVLAAGHEELNAMTIVRLLPSAPSSAPSRRLSAARACLGSAAVGHGCGGSRRDGAGARAGECRAPAIVIDFGDGVVQSACVDLGADGQATGEEVLASGRLRRADRVQPHGRRRLQDWQPGLRLSRPGLLV